MDGDCGHRCVCSGENSAFAHRRGVDEDREQYQGGGRGEYFTRRGFLKAVILICAVLAVISVLPETAEFSVKAQTAIDGTFFTHVIRDHNPLLSWLEKIIESAKARAGM